MIRSPPSEPGGRMWNTSDHILRCDRVTLHQEGCSGARPGQKVCRSLLVTSLSSLSAATVTKLRM